MRFQARQKGEVPRFLGPVLHGSFGHALISLQDCYPLADELIETSSSQGASSPSSANHTQPYVFQVDLTAGGSVHAGYTFDVRFVAKPVLALRAEYLPLLLQAFLILGQRGLGPDRVPFDLLGATLDPAPLFRPVEESVEIVPLLIEGCSVAARMPHSDRAQVVFRTPVRLTSKGQVLDKLDGPVFFRRLWQRMAAWSDVDLGEEVKPPAFGSIEVVEDRTHWWMAGRWSSRQEKQIDISGLVGKATITGLDSTAWNLLLLGEHLHVGKNTTCGLGRYQVFPDANSGA